MTLHNARMTADYCLAAGRAVEPAVAYAHEREGRPA